MGLPPGVILTLGSLASGRDQDMAMVVVLLSTLLLLLCCCATCTIKVAV